MSMEGGSTYKPDDGEDRMKGADVSPSDFSMGENALESFSGKNSEKLKNLKKELFVMTNGAVSPTSYLQQLEIIESQIREITDETLVRLKENDFDQFDKKLMDMVTTYGKDFVLNEIKLQEKILEQEIKLEENYHAAREN